MPEPNSFLGGGSEPLSRMQRIEEIDEELVEIVEVDTASARRQRGGKPAARLRKNDTRSLLTVPMTVLVQDPLVRDKTTGRILTAAVRVPVDRLEPGPRTSRFSVIQHRNPRRPQAPTRLCAAGDKVGWTYIDRFKKCSDDDLCSNPDFRAQNAYAVAARTLAAFERALGRRVAWAFGEHQLTLIVAESASVMASYARAERAVTFGFKVGGGTTIYAALSHDVVVHEITHAILDGERPRYNVPGLPDQGAFDEAFADLTALLSVFAIPEAVAMMLPEPDAEGRIAIAAISPKALEASPLFGIGEELAGPLGLSATRGALRRAVGHMTGDDVWRRDEAYEERYQRSTVLVAAVMRGLLAVWGKRLEDLAHNGHLSKTRSAEEGTKAAADLLAMCIRALDYTPPVEFEFGDFLDAILLVDEVVAPDDPHRYRAVLRETFKDVDIRAPARTTVTPTKNPIYHGLNPEALAGDPDEVHRYIWHNADLLGLDLTYPVRVERVYRAQRVGPQGLVVGEVVADYTQRRTVTVTELRVLLRKHGQAAPRQLRGSAEVELWGGGTLVFNEFGRLRYHQTKPLDDWERQAERLRFLSKRGKVIAERYGFADERSQDHGCIANSVLAAGDP